MKKMIVALAGLLVLRPIGSTDEPATPLERYRKLEFPPKEENFGKGWQARVALEYDVINTLTYAAQPTFSSPTSYVNDVDLLLEELKKAAH